MKNWKIQFLIKYFQAQTCFTLRPLPVTWPEINSEVKFFERLRYFRCAIIILESVSFDLHFPNGHNSLPHVFFRINSTKKFFIYIFALCHYSHTHIQLPTAHQSKLAIDRQVTNLESWPIRILCLLLRNHWRKRSATFWRLTWKLLDNLINSFAVRTYLQVF